MLCSHYLPKQVEIIAPCCNTNYPCRFCHDETTDHSIDRFAVTEMLCKYCDIIMDISGKCSNKLCTSYSKDLAIYYCDKCKFFTNDDKDVYHCDDCGVCRNKTHEDNTHCFVCGVCHVPSATVRCLPDSHSSNCPICIEPLKFTRKTVTILGCGHVLHANCLVMCCDNGIRKCPICRTHFSDYIDEEYFIMWDCNIEEVHDEMLRKFRLFRYQD